MASSEVRHKKGLFPFGSPNTMGVGALCYVSFAVIAPHVTMGRTNALRPTRAREGAADAFHATAVRRVSATYKPFRFRARAQRALGSAENARPRSRSAARRHGPAPLP
jgi:hypothetical protein